MPFSKPPPRRLVRPVQPLYHHMKFLLNMVKRSTVTPENGKQEIVARIFDCMNAQSDDTFRERYDMTKGDVEQWLDANHVSEEGISWRQILQNFLSRAQNVQAQQPNVGNCLQCGAPLQIDPLNQDKLICRGCGWFQPQIRETKATAQKVKAKPRSLRSHPSAQPTAAAQSRESKILSDHVAQLKKAIVELKKFASAPNYNGARHDRTLLPLIADLEKAAAGSLGDNRLRGMKPLRMARALLAGTSRSTGIEID